MRRCLGYTAMVPGFQWTPYVRGDQQAPNHIDSGDEIKETEQQLREEISRV